MFISIQQGTRRVFTLLYTFAFAQSGILLFNNKVRDAYGLILFDYTNTTNDVFLVFPFLRLIPRCSWVRTEFYTDTISFLNGGPPSWKTAAFMVSTLPQRVGKVDRESESK